LKDLHVKAKRYALNLLRYRGRSEKELGQKLRRRNIPEHIIASIIESLKKSGLVNDQHLAENLKQHALSIKLYSHRSARQFVLSRGIPRVIVDIIFARDDYSDIENARKLIRKKMNALKKYPHDVSRMRIYRSLSRKGYSSGTITRALKENDLQEEENL
jgi:regulatory protein